MKSITRRTFLWQSGAALGGLAAAPLLETLPASGQTNAVAVTRLNDAHWGLFTAEVVGGRVVRTMPFGKDPHPNAMVTVMPDLLYGPEPREVPDDPPRLLP